MNISPVSASYFAQDTNVTAASLSSRQFVFITAEGDKVSLSSLQAQAQSYSSYNEKGQLTNQDGKSSAQSTTAASASIAFSSYSLSVEGDLSKKELRDIRKAIHRIDHIEHQLEIGNTKNVERESNKLNRLDSLAAIGWNFIDASEVTASQTTTEASVETNSES